VRKTDGRTITWNRTGTDERGFALLGVFVTLLMMTVLGIAGLTMTGLENRMAGFAGTSDAAMAAAESCAGTAANVIDQVIALGEVPTAYIVGGAGALNPVVPWNAENAAAPTLTQEIMDESGTGANNPDIALGAGASPDIQFNVGPMTVVADIDRLYIRYPQGCALEFQQEGSSSGCAEIIYRVDCQAQNVATGIVSRTTATYACRLNKDTCQKKYL
jgi:Tfp pilus assembly protein PilX